MKYESSILKRLIDTYGVIGNPRYLSEIIKEFIVQGKECYPNLFTYQSDWLAHIDEFGLTPEYTVSYTGQQIYAPNTKERPVKRAILKGSTKYRDIDTGEVLETFEEGRNLELVSVKMPVLTTSNEDGTKTNILNTSKDVVLRGIGNVKDELDCLTGEVTERIGEIVLDGSENWRNTTTSGAVRFSISLENLTTDNKRSPIISDYFPYASSGHKYPSSFVYDGLLYVYLEKTTTLEELKTWLGINKPSVQYQLATDSIKTVDLTILDQNRQNVKQLMSFNGGTHFNTTSLEGSLLPTLSVDVVTDLEETLKVCSLEGNTM